MSVRVAINGFGRIGRLILRSIIETGRDDLNVVAINDLASAQTHAHLLKYDSIHGRLAYPVDVKTDQLDVNGHPIRVVMEKDPSQLPWQEMDIDIVMECSGRFTKRQDSELHLTSGAKKVLISAPATDEDLTVVFGVNHGLLRAEHQIVSNASCTTNCLAPVAYVLHNTIGIAHGFMTTIHSYTGDQKIVDTIHNDWKRGRAAAINMIPTSTGAARAVTKILPELKGKIDGTSVRVPIANVSLIDFTFTACRPTSVDEISSIIKEAAHSKPLKNILTYYDVPLVSSDFNHDPHSAIFALQETKVIQNTFVRVLIWYDNEWGTVCRMCDTAAAMAQTLR